MRCPKFLRCLTADAGNFDRGHSLISLLPPPAALDSLPSPRRRHASHLQQNPCHCEPVRTPVWQSVLLLHRTSNLCVGAGFYPARSAAPSQLSPVGRHPCVPPPTRTAPPTAGHTGAALQEKIKTVRRGRYPHHPAADAHRIFPLKIRSLTRCVRLPMFCYITAFSPRHPCPDE